MNSSPVSWGGQYGGGFIQNEDAGAPEQRLDDFHPLAFPHRQVADLGKGVQVHVVFLGDLGNLLGGGLQIQPHSACIAGADQAVFHHRHGGHQHKVLMHHADADGHGVPGGAKRHMVSLDADLPGGGFIQAAQNVHQGAFPRAVFPQEGMDLAGLYAEAYVRIGQYAGKLLINMLHFQYGCHWRFLLILFYTASPGLPGPRRCGQRQPAR